MKTVFIIIIAAVCVLILFFSEAAMAGASKGFETFISGVFPALFPFSVCISALKYTGALAPAESGSGDSCRSGNGGRNGNAGFIKATLRNFVIAAVSGYPAGTMLSQAAFRREYGSGSENGTGSGNAVSELTSGEFGMLCAATSLASPVFITGAVANRMLKNSGSALPVAVCHYGTALLFLLFFIIKHIRNEKGRNRNGKSGRTEKRAEKGTKNAGEVCQSIPIQLPRRKDMSFSAIFPKAVSDSVSIMLRLGGTLIFFTVITEISASWDIFGNMPAFLKGMLFGSFEITNGISLIASCGMGMRLKCALICSLLSFGGICVYMQAAGIAAVRPGSYFLTKSVQAAVSGGLCYLIYPLFSPVCGPVSGLFGDTLPERIISMGELAILGVFASVCAILICVFTVKRTKA